MSPRKLWYASGFCSALLIASTAARVQTPTAPRHIAEPAANASSANVSFGHHPAGHMVYLNVDALKEMHADLEKWYSTGH